MKLPRFLAADASPAARAVTLALPARPGGDEDAQDNRKSGKCSKISHIYFPWSTQVAYSTQIDTLLLPRSRRSAPCFAAWLSRRSFSFSLDTHSAAEPEQVQSPLQVAGAKGTDSSPDSKSPRAAPQVVTKTIYVPHVTYKSITVTDYVCTQVPRQRTVHVTRMVPETRMVVRRFPVVTPQTRTAIQSYMVCHMDYEKVQGTTTVCVPYTEMRQGVRTVCNMVKETVMQTVTEEGGHWDIVTPSGPVQKGAEQAPLQKGPIQAPIQKGRVWVPEVIKRQVPVTTWRPQYTQVPYEYPVHLTRLEARPITRTVPRPRYERKEREVHYTVCVTTYEEREVPFTVCRPVVEERVVHYTELVRTPVAREVRVPVCTMVPKTITYTIQPCYSCTPCGH